jgi:RNA polymerase-interacting CarD/CdnL/TRCF family regulator
LINYKIGDTVVHWTHGQGTIIAIDELLLAGVSQQYYVIEVEQFKFWVPIEEANEGSIRFPMESIQFKSLLEILRMPGEKLPDNQYKRKIDLRQRMQKRTPEGLCHVIRDLSDRSHQHPLNQNDSSVLFRAEEYLLDEWVISMGDERSKALLELEGLLRNDQPELRAP